MTHIFIFSSLLAALIWNTYTAVIYNSEIMGIISIFLAVILMVVAAAII